MIIGEDPAPAGVQQGVDAVVAVDHVHDLARAGIVAHGAEHAVAAQVLLGALADDVLALGVQAAHRLDAVRILVGRVHIALVVHVDTGELRRDEELLLGALFLGGHLAPELFPQADLDADGAEEAGEVALRGEDHDALEHVLGHTVHAVGIVHADFERREHEFLVQDLALGVLHVLDEGAVQLQHYDAVVLGVRHVQLFVLGYRHTVGRAEGLLFAVGVKVGDHLEHRLQIAGQYHDAVIARIGDVDVPFRGYAQVLGHAERAQGLALPLQRRAGDTAIRHVGRGRVQDVVPVVVIVAVIGQAVVGPGAGGDQTQHRGQAERPGEAFSHSHVCRLP